jgi:tRNA A-37 threonylcarbamoyl transferase component Bud32
MHAVMGTGRLIAGRYRLQDPIGRGAMGIVWRGRDELLDRDVAVKEVQVTAPSGAADTEVVYQRTLREARTAARLSHPSVVTVFDVVEEDGSPWIVMELIQARSLDRVITEDGPLPPEQAADLGTSLVSALATAHSAGVLHRDVKPSNVLVTGDGRAILTDFGIATFAEDLGLTQQGMVVGTPGFTAPERIRGDIATPASDLWSLGATLYAAVEGRGPFDRVGGSSVISAGVAAEDAPRAPSAGPLGPVIDALLSRDPGTRPDAPTAARLLADAATAARTGPRPLQDDWLAARADRDAGPDLPTSPGVAGAMSSADSGFLNPPDYEVLQIPGSADAPLGEAGSAGSGERAGLAAAAVAPASMLDPSSGPALWGPQKGPSSGSQPRAAAAEGPGGAASGGAANGGGAGQGGGGSGSGGSGSGGSGKGGPGTLPAWRSSGKWRVMVAGAGIAAIVVAAIIGWNIFKHSGPASALDNAAPLGTQQATGSNHGHSSGAAGHGGTGSQRSGDPTPGSSSGGQSSAPTKGHPSGKPGTSSSPAPGHHSAKPTATTAASGSTSPSPSTSASASSSPDPSPSGSTTTPTGVTLPAGWKWHSFTAPVMGSVAGFKIGMPDAWTQAVNGQIADLTQPSRAFHLDVNLGYWVYAKPLRQAQYLETLAAAAHKHSYKVLELESVGFKALGGYRSATAGVLKYSWYNTTLAYNQTEEDILVTLATSNGSQQYEFELWAPTSTYGAASNDLWNAMPTFRTLPS